MANPFPPTDSPKNEAGASYPRTVHPRGWLVPNKAIIEVTDELDTAIKMVVGKPQRVRLWCGSKKDFEVTWSELPTGVTITPVDGEDDGEAQVYDLQASVSGGPHAVDFFFRYRELLRVSSCPSDAEVDTTLHLTVLDADEANEAEEEGDKPDEGEKAAQ